MFSHTVRSWVLLILVVGTTFSRASGQGSLRAEDLTDDHVQGAIDAIVVELFNRKHAERFWDPEKVPVGESTRQKGGYTALTVLSLLYAGQTYQEPRLRDAVDYLAGFGMDGTYAVSLRNNIWARLPAKYSSNLNKDTQWLLDGFSEQAGGWDYVQNPRTNRQDNSIRQFGALALWESAKRGLKVEKRCWQRLEEAYLDMQLDDGGWNYTGDGPATGSMTAAGLATLFITQDFLHAGESVKLGDRKPSRHEQAIERGLQWMSANFSPTENPGKNTYFYYYLYGVERVGLASGFARFGNKDWFRLGAAELIRRLCKWDEATRTFTVHDRTGGDGRATTVKTDDLAFGLMFLSRGRAPVAVNKLDFGGTDRAWNNRPRDVANLVRWIGESSESDLNWQIVPLSDRPERWFDAPLLFMASDAALPFMRDLPAEMDGFIREAKEFVRLRSTGALPLDAKPPQRPEFADSTELDKLKRYLDLGGMIVALNEGPTHHFADSIEKAGQIMYPQFEWRPLPDDHWAYTINLPVKSRRPQLKGLSNGVREVIIFSPSGDLPTTFQAADLKNEPVYQTAANIYFYASEMNRPRPRLARHAPEVDAPAEDAKNGRVTIVRAIHEGNWKPEPQALPVFASTLGASSGIAANIVDHPLDALHALLSRPVVVIVSGIEAHEFSQSQLDSIKAFVSGGGGVILFETPGGRGPFASSARQAMEALFGQPAQGLPGSRIITGLELPGAVNVARVDYRPYSLQTFAARENTPRLTGITVDGQPRVLFSDEDLSNALLDQPCWGVSGYTTQSARDLLTNIVLHAMMSRSAPVP